MLRFRNSFFLESNMALKRVTKGFKETNASPELKHRSKLVGKRILSPEAMQATYRRFRPDTSQHEPEPREISITDSVETDQKYNAAVCHDFFESIDIR